MARSPTLTAKVSLPWIRKFPRPFKRREPGRKNHVVHILNPGFLSSSKKKGGPIAVLGMLLGQPATSANAQVVCCIAGVLGVASGLALASSKDLRLARLTDEMMHEPGAGSTGAWILLRLKGPTE
jgi:hypothetical protein